MTYEFSMHCFSQRHRFSIKLFSLLTQTLSRSLSPIDQHTAREVQHLAATLQSSTDSPVSLHLFFALLVPGQIRALLLMRFPSGHPGVINVEAPTQGLRAGFCVTRGASLPALIHSSSKQETRTCLYFPSFLFLCCSSVPFIIACTFQSS